MNLLGIHPYIASPIVEIANQIGDALMRFYDENRNIEIEFKYAEIKQFFNIFVLQDLQRIKMEENVGRQVCDVANFHAMKQNNYHLQTLFKLSRFNLILLNGIDKKYELKGDFYESRHRKFYKMREFLEKLCYQN